MGIIGLGASWKPLSECAFSNQTNNWWGIAPPRVCEFPNYSDGTIGVVLIIAGIKKKSSEPKSNPKQKSTS